MSKNDDFFSKKNSSKIDLLDTNKELLSTLSKNFYLFKKCSQKTKKVFGQYPKIMKKLRFFFQFFFQIDHLDTQIAALKTLPIFFAHSPKLMKSIQFV